MPITRLYGWDCGNSMIPSANMDAGGYISANTGSAKTGAYSLRFNRSGGGSASAWARFPMPAGTSNPSISIWVYISNGYDTNNVSYLQFELSTGETIELRWNGTSHTFDAYVNTALVASGTVSLLVNAWFHVQFSLTIADAGSIDVKIDGRESIAYSGDTQPAGAATVTYFYIRQAVKLAAWTIYYDDLAIGYGGYLGDIRCIDIRPTADTAVDDWTPSAGDNYATIDETPPSDADYNETNVDAQADELALGDFDGVTYNPVAVTAWVRARMEAATGDSIKVGIDSGGTDDVTEHALSTAWQYYFHTADQNPADAAEWEDADIDALLLRYESVIA